MKAEKCVRIPNYSLDSDNKRAYAKRAELFYERLIKILSLYRLTLGQARQEELLEYIFQNCDDTEDLKKLFINLSPYYKSKTE